MAHFLRFSIIIAGVCLFAFMVHVSVLMYLDMPVFGNKIILAYTGNYFLAVVIMAVLLFAPSKLQNSLGFLFMLGSIFKFGFFFLFFYPDYLGDGDIKRDEFLAFFAPYSVCLIAETKLLINKLSRD